jgi:hypothetical protein
MVRAYVDYREIGLGISFDLKEKSLILEVPFVMVVIKFNKVFSWLKSKLLNQ